MSNVVELLTSLLEQVTPSKNHTSDQWSNIVSVLKNNLNESRDIISSSSDPLTESLSTILTTLQSSKPAETSLYKTLENKADSSRNNEKYASKSETGRKSDTESSECVDKESVQLSEPETQIPKRKKYSLTSVFRSFFGKNKYEELDEDYNYEYIDDKEESERKSTPERTVINRSRSSSPMSYLNYTHSPRSPVLLKRTDTDVSSDEREVNFKEDLSGRVPPLDFKLLKSHDHETTPESSDACPNEFFSKSKTDRADENNDMKHGDNTGINFSSGLLGSLKGSASVMATSPINSVNDRFNISDYRVRSSTTNNPEANTADRSISASGIDATNTNTGTASEGVICSGNASNEGGMDAVRGGSDTAGRCVTSASSSITSSGSKHGGDANVSDTSLKKQEDAIIGDNGKGDANENEKETEYRDNPREFINKMRESKDQVYTPLREINNSTNKVNLYLVATEMIKSKLFIFKRKLYVFNYNAVDPSIYYNQSYVHPEVDYSIQILAPIDGRHHHINFGDILRLKRVDAHVKHEKGKKYINILIPDKCNPTVRAWRVNNLDTVSSSSNEALSNGTKDNVSDNDTASNTSGDNEIVVVSNEVGLGNVLVISTNTSSGAVSNTEDRNGNKSGSGNSGADSSFNTRNSSIDVDKSKELSLENKDTSISGNINTNDEDSDCMVIDADTIRLNSVNKNTVTLNEGGGITNSDGVETGDANNGNGDNSFNVENDKFETWKRDSITLIGSDNLTYTVKDFNILNYLKEYSKKLDPVKVFRRPDLIRTLSQANFENFDFIVKVHNVAKDFTFTVSDSTAKALVVELDPMLIANVFRSYDPIKKGDWVKLRSFYKAEDCASLTLKPSSFACITRLPPMSQKVVGDEPVKPAEKNTNRTNNGKVNGVSGSKKENGRNRTVNLEVWTRTSCLNNSFPKRFKKSPTFIEKLLSTHHTVTFQKASPEPVKVEKEEGEISQ